ncbi:ATPase family protein associated with various cellular activities (AAA) [Yoonia maritima]|uniref:ATPase family protein associated with various cellular activities (AAA) n=1 Tax=Yoonia maritima TaxID=1435347 RepID=A0A2T0VXP2_9RHOB|nr:AAA family ATPase [Yoonia maritima]PRY76843.1 ATPase family protein associated with various cellular activities (AAA) [Yoonia maritima]
MTHYLKDFTELLPRRPDLDDVKADFLQKAEAVGMIDFLRDNSVSQKTVEHRVKEEISDFMTANVAEIIEQRGLIDHDQIELLGFTHEDPDEDFVAAIRDAVQVSFVYEAAREHHRKETGLHDRALKNAGPKDEVQKFVKELATAHPVLVGPSTLHAVDEMIAELHASAPWMSDVSTWAYKALRARYNTGQTWLNLPPVILIGPPGCGKSTYARKLAALSGAPVRTLDVGSSNASFTVAGCDATWSKAQGGVPLQEIAKTGIANPIMIVDEIEKAGTMTASGGSRVSLPDALLGLLEPTSSTAWGCPFTRRTYNMSQISWIMTANERDGIPAPLLDRCRVFNIGYPEGKDLVDLIRRLSAGRIFEEVVNCLIARVLAAVASPVVLERETVVLFEPWLFGERRGN